MPPDKIHICDKCKSEGKVLLDSDTHADKFCCIYHFYKIRLKIELTQRKISPTSI